MSFFEELKRRSVLRVALGYLAAAWLLLQIADVVLNNLGAPAWVFPGLLWLLAIGFVPALVLAWVFEFTPDGIALDRDAGRGTRRLDGTTKKFDRVIMVVLAAAVAYFAVDKFVLRPTPDTSINVQNSIAVLPFVNMSDDAANEYFADGISEELLNLLAQIPELRVISRSSAFAFKGKDIDIPTVAEKLDVTHVLGGSVRKAGNDVRITAQLIEARSDTHVWSDTYDRTLQDIFEIQNEVAAEVVAQLKIKLLGQVAKADPVNPKAYNLFLQARHVLEQYSGRLEQAESLLKQALKLEPNYALALAELARTYARQLYAEQRPAEELEPLITEAMEKAMRTEPNNATVQLYYGGMLRRRYDDNAVAAPYFSRAVELAPTDVHILRLAGSFARRIGDIEASNTISKYLIARDPLCTDCKFRLALGYRAVGRLDEADELLRTVLLLDPDFEEVHYLLGSNQLLRGNAQAALQEFDLDEGQFRAEGRIMALHDLGRNAEFDAELAAFRETPDTLDGLLMIYAWIGDADAAFAVFDKMRQTFGDVPQIILYAPLLKKLHDDPRWHELLEKVGKSPEQLAKIEFDVKLPN